jgi:uncharacterized protein YraI
LPATLTLVGGTAALGPTSNLAAAITTPKLDRIRRQEHIVEADDTASLRLQLIWQRTMEAIENAFEAIDVRDDDQDTVIARLEAAEALAASAKAESAATAAEDVLVRSYPNPSAVLTASNAGGITIAAHDRVYGDGTTVAVNSGSLSGYSPGDYVQVYYDDAARAGGAVNYQGTLDLVAQSGARHIVGGAPIPLAGEPPMSGFPPFPPGFAPDYREFGI